MNATLLTRAHRGADSFPELLAALSKPDAYPYPVAGAEPHVIQTHASAVLLTQERAYKLKKPKNFGFFDFSTPALRRRDCMLEVTMNARLAPSVYLGVAPVLAMNDGRVLFGNTLPPSQVPQPGVTVDGATVIDFAVVMVRLPEKATLQSHVAVGTASVPLIRQVARRVATFHAQAHSEEHIARFGALDVIRANWDENLAQVRPYVGRALDQQTFDQIEQYVNDFLRHRAALFASRVRDGRIRDCHGDLRLQHVYALGEEPDPGGHLAIIDCIEFNERFRYGDVASEVAFLAMELEAAGRLDLAHAFVEAYLEETGDEALRELLPFYVCYRACVRAKVQAFLLNEPEVPATQRDAAVEQARELFALAQRYAGGRTRPALVLVGGTMGTGKSTLAARLHQALGWPLLSSDVMRKRLAQLELRAPIPEAYGQGMYSTAWTERTYEALLQTAKSTLKGGRSVLLDATYGWRGYRLAVAELARDLGAQPVVVECRCAPEIAKERLARRWQARTNRAPKEPATGGLAASDGRPELFDAQRASWQPYDPHIEGATAHLVVATDSPNAKAVGRIIEELGGALACNLALEAGPAERAAEATKAPARCALPS